MNEHENIYMYINHLELSLLSKHEAEVSDLKSQNEKTIVDLKQEFISKESVSNKIRINNKLI